MKGIDISSYQTNIDFQKVKNSGVEIVYIKATEGLTYNNLLMKEQYTLAKAAGLKVGFYHFLRANNPAEEAQHFLNIVQGLSIDCKHAIDVEIPLGQTKTQISSNVRKFADYLISNGKEVIKYTGDNFLSECLDGTVANIPLWVANYSAIKPIAANYIGFQHSQSGSVDGVAGLVDLDEFNEDIFVTVPVTVKVQTPAPTVSSNSVIRTFQIATIKCGLNANNGLVLSPDGERGPLTNQVISKLLIFRSMKSDLVMWLQHRLIALGFSCGTAGADGDFGFGTLTAVQNFQASRGLTSDGKVGPKTINSLLK